MHIQCLKILLHMVQNQVVGFEARSNHTHQTRKKIIPIQLFLSLPVHWRLQESPVLTLQDNALSNELDFNTSVHFIM